LEVERAAPTTIPHLRPLEDLFLFVVASGCKEWSRVFLFVTLSSSPTRLETVFPGRLKKGIIFI
jgi:hypothetical protein